MMEGGSQAGNGEARRGHALDGVAHQTENTEACIPSNVPLNAPSNIRSDRMFDRMPDRTPHRMFDSMLDRTSHRMSGRMFDRTSRRAIALTGRRRGWLSENGPRPGGACGGGRAGGGRSGGEDRRQERAAAGTVRTPTALLPLPVSLCTGRYAGAQQQRRVRGAGGTGLCCTSSLFALLRSTRRKVPWAWGSRP